MRVRRLAPVGVALVVAACATVRPPLEQHTTQGPSAQGFWVMRVALENGREPTFDEQIHWEDQMDRKIAAYLRDHPEDANALEVTAFRFSRQPTVGMSKEQVLILLGPPIAVTTDPDEMAKWARRYWPALRGNVTEAWTYPLGWNFYFAGQRLRDITQYLPR